jgi:hypothetical protein
MSVFSYGLDETAQKFTEAGLRLLSLSDLDALLNVGVANSVISPEQQRVVRNWAKDPQGWATDRT